MSKTNSQGGQRGTDQTWALCLLLLLELLLLATLVFAIITLLLASMHNSLGLKLALNALALLLVLNTLCLLAHCLLGGHLVCQHVLEECKDPSLQCISWYLTVDLLLLNNHRCVTGCNALGIG